MSTVTEGALAFDFEGAVRCDRLDTQGEPLPVGMKLVDFAVEEDERLLLLEVKDPSNPGATEQQQKDFARKLSTKELVNHDVVPKARDSYTFLHLMGRDSKPMLLVLLLGDDRLPLEPALLLALKEQLLARVKREASEPWAREYVTDCVVTTLTTWQRHFPSYTARRRTAQKPQPNA